MKMSKADCKFLKELVGKKVGFSMGARPVGAIDEKQLVIHDVAVCIQGEALGHGVWLDEAFIRDVVAQGNAAEKGLLCHFGHEDSNAGRIKNYMGVFSNFVEKPSKSHEGEDVIGAYADIKFSKTANEKGDNVEWVMGLARERPDALGLSIVFSVGDYKVKTEDGTDVLWSEFIADRTINTWKEYYAALDEFFAQSADGKLYIVLAKLYGADFVAEGAATDGLFAAGKIEDADELAAAIKAPLLALERLSDDDDAPAEGAEGAAGAGDAPADGAEGAEGAGEAPADGAEGAEGGGEAPAEGAEGTEGAGEAPAEGAEGASAASEVARMKAECDKRIAGFQSMHDKKISELNGQIEGLRTELEAAKSALSAARTDLDAKVKELGEVVADRDGLSERLASVEDAHRKLTGCALTIGSGTPQVMTMSEFVSYHGHSLSRAVREDPETYKRICAANGWKPVALGR